MKQIIETKCVSKNFYVNEIDYELKAISEIAKVVSESPFFTTSDYINCIGTIRNHLSVIQNNVNNMLEIDMEMGA